MFWFDDIVVQKHKKNNKTHGTVSTVLLEVLALLILSRLLNTTFEAWTTANILQPLGMSNTGFGTPNSSNMAPVPMFAMDLGWFVPAGDMYSTVADLTKLGKMFTQPGKQNLFKVWILSKASA